MSRLEATPDPTPAEAAAIRRALEAIGMVEAEPGDGSGEHAADRPATPDP